MKKEHIYLSIAVGAMLMYFYTKRSLPSTKNLSGVDVNIDSDRLMNGTMAFMGINPLWQDPIKKVANRVIDRMIR